MLLESDGSMNNIPSLLNLLISLKTTATLSLMFFRGRNKLQLDIGLLCFEFFLVSLVLNDSMNSLWFHFNESLHQILKQI